MSWRISSAMDVRMPGKYEKLRIDLPQIRSMDNTAPTKEVDNATTGVGGKQDFGDDEEGGFATGRRKGGGCEGVSVSGGRSQEGMDPDLEGVNLF